ICRSANADASSRTWGATALFTPLRRPRLGNEGFSLAETLTAVAITAIVASVVVSRTVAPRTNSEAAAVVQTLYRVGEAMTAYRRRGGRYPAVLRDLVTRPPVALDTCGRTFPHISSTGGRVPTSGAPGTPRGSSSARRCCATGSSARP